MLLPRAAGAAEVAEVSSIHHPEIPGKSAQPNEGYGTRTTQQSAVQFFNAFALYSGGILILIARDVVTTEPGRTYICARKS